MKPETHSDIKNLLRAIADLDIAWSEWNMASDEQKRPKALAVAHALGAVCGCRTIVEIDLDWERKSCKD